MEMMFNGRVDCLIDRLYDEAKDAARVHEVYRVEIVHEYDHSTVYVAEWVEAEPRCCSSGAPNYKGLERHSTTKFASSRERDDLPRQPG